MRSPACTFSKVTSYWSIGWSRSASICSAAGLMSSVSNVAPNAVASSVALVRVWTEVAKPGIVNARMSLRGRPSSSIARAATSSAWVESSPPDTPMTTLGPPMAVSRCLSPYTWML